jgi:hypothetical protein
VPTPSSVGGRTASSVSRERCACCLLFPPAATLRRLEPSQASTLSVERTRGRGSLPHQAFPTGRRCQRLMLSNAQGVAGLSLGDLSTPAVPLNHAGARQSCASRRMAAKRPAFSKPRRACSARDPAAESWRSGPGERGWIKIKNRDYWRALRARGSGSGSATVRSSNVRAAIAMSAVATVCASTALTTVVTATGHFGLRWSGRLGRQNGIGADCF